MRNISLFLPAILACVLPGCSRNPNIEIVGSYFPGWMVSLAIAVVLTITAHMLLRRYSMEHTVGHPALIYPGMVLLFTCMLWLCCFS